MLQPNYPALPATGRPPSRPAPARASLAITAAAIAALSIAASPALAGPDPTRDVLWTALKTCLLAKRLADRAFPCLSVDLGDAERPGTAVLRAPGQRSHFVVMPTDTVSGVEAPVLRGPHGAAYWRAALAARHLVADAAGHGLAAGDVGLAVNSVGGRSQDQLHIHLGCVRPDVTRALRRAAGHVGEGWHPLPVRLQGTLFLALRVGAEQLAAFNPFAAAGHLPDPAGSPRGASLRDVSLAMVPLPTDGGRDLVLLAYRAPNAHAEKLLDTACAARP